MGVVQQDTKPREENVGCSPTHKAKTEEEEERNCGGVWLTKGCGPWSAQVGQVDMITVVDKWRGTCKYSRYPCIVFKNRWEMRCSGCNTVPLRILECGCGRWQVDWNNTTTILEGSNTFDKHSKYNVNHVTNSF